MKRGMVESERENYGSVRVREKKSVWWNDWVKAVVKKKVGA